MCNIANYLKLYKKLNEKAQPWQRRKEGSKKQPVTICNGFVSLYGGYGRLPLKRSLRMMDGNTRMFAVVTRRVTRTVSEMPRPQGPFRKPRGTLFALNLQVETEYVHYDSLKNGIEILRFNEIVVLSCDK